MKHVKLRIAIVGTRGIPANYSGFETCVEELGARLVKRGYEVVVYCRSHHIKINDKFYKGMRLVKLPTIQNKYFDTIVHTFLSTLHVSFWKFDIVLIFIAGNSPVSFIPRLTGAKVILNVDGLDWKRKKWNMLAKKYIQSAEYLATIFPNGIVTDSKVIEKYYLEKYRKNSTYIAYGADVVKVAPGRYLKKFGLQERKYILFVGRLVPENCVHHLVEAFEGIETNLKCVIVGDAPYAKTYIQSLKSTKNPNIIFTGYLFGEGYRELCSNAGLFVETSEVGGTHPALLEAMGFGNCVIVNNTPENLETIEDAGFSYNGKKGGTDLQGQLKKLISNLGLVNFYRKKGQERVKRFYSWEKVTDKYESLFLELVS